MRPERVTNVEQAMDDENDAGGLSALTKELETTRCKLAHAIARMDRARNILTNGNPTPECNWGMLDTTDLRSNARLSRQGGADDA